MTQAINVRPLRTEADYDAALAAVRPYFDNPPESGSADADRFELLILVIKAWEDAHIPIPDASPVEVVKLVMEANGYSRADLAEILGAPSRASEFLNRRRSLSLEQIRRLRAEWGIPADALIGEAEAA